jgi:hypothetical protein
MDSKDMKNRFSEKPLCKFGPGGDFVHELSPKEVLPKAATQGNPLGKVLEIIAEMVGAAIGPELLLDCVQPLNIDQKELDFTIKAEKTKNENNQSGLHYYHPQTTGRTSGNRCVSKQAMLFADDGRSSPFPGHKAPHRIRACRRTTRKRADRIVVQRQGSGTLFAGY